MAKDETRSERAATERAAEENGQGGPMETARQAVGGIAGVAAGASRMAADATREAAARFPEAASTTRDAVEEANRLMRTGSDETLTAGATLSIGLALGLFIGGAPRFLVAVALVPAAAMGYTLLDRSERSRTRTTGAGRRGGGVQDA